ncbi:MAG: hypothetical protein ACI3V2_02495 [Faecousia sp.]
MKDIEKIADLPNGVLSDNGGLTDGKTTIFNTGISERFLFVKRFDHTFMENPANPLFLNENGTPMCSIVAQEGTAVSPCSRTGSISRSRSNTHSDTQNVGTRIRFMLYI